MFSRHALFWQTSQSRTSLTTPKQLKVQLNIFDKQVSPSCWLFWAALYQGAVSYGSPGDNQIYQETSVRSFVGIEHITF